MRQRSPKMDPGPSIQQHQQCVAVDLQSIEQKESTGEEEDLKFGCQAVLTIPWNS